MNKEKAFETIIVLTLVSIICYLLFKEKWIFYISIILLVIPIISTKLALLIGKIWLSFSEYLGLIMNFILMSISFFIFLIPLSFLQRLFGKNQILKKQKGNSYFIKREHLFTSKDIKNPW